MAVLIDDLCFPEGPRWHEGRLYFSDLYANEVIAVDAAGRREVVTKLADEPSGLGWLPDGRLLVVGMRERKLFRVDPDGIREAADLSALAAHHCNDMVVDAQGRAYIGNLGYDVHAPSAEQRPAALVLALPNGETRAVADDLIVPNGCVITPDGGTLIVAESLAGRLTAFDIAADGSLDHRRVWAELPGGVPDGICLDAEGAVWVASPVAREVVRVLEGGEITQRLQFDRLSVACMLGGPQRKTLFVCTAHHAQAEACRARRTGRIETVEVDVPGAGFP